MQVVRALEIVFVWTFCILCWTSVGASAQNQQNAVYVYDALTLEQLGVFLLQSGATSAKIGTIDGREILEVEFGIKIQGASASGSVLVLSLCKTGEACSHFMMLNGFPGAHALEKVNTINSRQGVFSLSMSAGQGEGQYRYTAQRLLDIRAGVTSGNIYANFGNFVEMFLAAQDFITRVHTVQNNDFKSDIKSLGQKAQVEKFSFEHFANKSGIVYRDLHAPK